MTVGVEQTWWMCQLILEATFLKMHRCCGDFIWLHAAVAADRDSLAKGNRRAALQHRALETLVWLKSDWFCFVWLLRLHVKMWPVCRQDRDVKSSCTWSDPGAQLKHSRDAFNDIVAHLEVAWIGSENVQLKVTWAVHTVRIKADSGHIWAKKTRFRSCVKVAWVTNSVFMIGVQSQVVSSRIEHLWSTRMDLFVWFTFVDLLLLIRSTGRTGNDPGKTPQIDLHHRPSGSTTTTTTAIIPVLLDVFPCAWIDFNLNWIAKKMSSDQDDRTRS